MKTSIAQIDLSSLSSGGRGLEYHESLSLQDFGAYRFPHRADVKLEIERHGDVVDVVGEAELEYGGICDRCLEEFQAPLKLEIDEHLAVLESTDPFSDSNVIHAGRLDLGDLVRQLVDAELPYVAQCRPACRGLCPTCGLNLNEGTCGCEAATKGDHG